jgi:hypothetical protein
MLEKRDQSKMDPELKRRWLEALRGDRYAQGQQVLRDYDGNGYVHCCLGVLLDVVDPAGWRSERSKCHRLGGRSSRGREAFIGAPGKLGLGRRQNALAKMNDDGRTFLEIADWIEREL